jgi:hypothetical protein
MFNKTYVTSEKRLHISDNLLKVISLREVYENKYSSVLQKITEFCKWHLSITEVIWQEI